jgi:flagellar hook assembly protein FlgD
MNLDTSNRTLANSYEAPGVTGSTALTDPSGAQITGRKPNRTLGQDDFFKLIAAQFSYQDPLNPQKDTDFIAQMAQFNTLDQTRLMQSDIAGLRAPDLSRGRFRIGVPDKNQRMGGIAEHLFGGGVGERFFGHHPA